MTTDGPQTPLAVRAFPSHPSPDRYFAAGSIEECRVRLMRTIERGDGPGLLIGAPGMGKTMLLCVLAESLCERFDVVSIASTQLCTRRALLQAILHGLGMPYNDREEGELRLALVERLQNASASPNGALLLVDEAQALPVRLLEELRILSNLARNGEPLVRLVLAGGQGLEEQFASTELESFNQRLAARCYLSAFNFADTVQYVRAHVAAAGQKAELGGVNELFEAEALESIYTATDGVPRLINQICDRAIVLAVEARASTIDQTLVQSAWSDLHQLPAPWHTPEASLGEPEAGVVEFGVLPNPDEATFNELLGPVNTMQGPDVVVSETAAPTIVGDWTADEALTTLSPAEPAPVQAIAPAEEVEEPDEEIPATPDAATLFGDSFEEEEVVIDRFASLDVAFSPATPAVSNTEDADFGPMVEQHAIAVDDSLEYELADEEPAPAEAEELVVEEVEASDSEPELVTEPHDAESFDAPEMDPIAVLPLDSGEAAEDEIRRLKSELGLGDPFADEDVLVIEPEPAPADAAPAEAHRQEYRQLFANLRNG